MNKIFAAALLVTSFTQAASAAPTLGVIGPILQRLSEMNNERLSKTTVKQTKQFFISGAAKNAPGGGAQVLEYVVSLFSNENEKPFGEETYLVIVDDGLNVLSIQKVLTVEKE